MEVLQRTANRGSISTGYDIDNSLKLEIDNNEWIYRSSPTAGNRKTFTISLWLKRACLGHIPAGGDEYLASQGSNARYHFASDTVRFMFESNSTELESSRKLRDSAAWYHIVLAVDTSQSTAADRVKLYINGEQEAWNNAEYPSLNQESDWMNTQSLYIGTRYAGDGDNDLAGYISEVVVLDGTQASPTDLGEYDEDSGIWKPKDLSGLTFGSEGFYYKFDNASSLGEDSSGEGHDANSFSNITSADQATDTPTNNFCTFNPLINQNNSPTISDGAMKSTGGGGTWNQTWGNMGVQNGKWYYEFKVTNTSSTGYFGASTAPAEGSYLVDAQLMYNTSFMVGSAASIDYYYWQNGSQVSDESTGWGTISTNDIIGIALDLDAATKTFTVYKNGTALSGTLSQPVDLPTNMQDEFIFPLYVQYENNADEANFGGYTVMSISSAATDANGYGTFEYAPPSGYYALCTKNLAEYG
jgi:hypothetical protein